MRLTKGLIVLAILLPYTNGLIVGLTESDYSGNPIDGYIAVAIDRSNYVSSNVTLKVTPMTYAEYNTRYSAALAIPSGCYGAQNSQFNNTPVQILITPSTLSTTIRFKIGLIDRNESQPPKSCFVIVLNVLRAGQQTVEIVRNVSAMYIYNSYAFTVSFETQEVTINGDVGTTKIFIVKDNNQKVAYNFTLKLLDLTPPPIKNANDTYYSVEQLAIPFPADMQRVPVVIKVTNFNFSMDNITLNFLITQTADYSVGQTNHVDVNIVNKNNVRVELENATHWLMVCLSVVDPILARQISLLIQARNITDEQVFFCETIYFDPAMTRRCINVTDNGNFSTFLVTVTALSNAVLIIPDRDIRAKGTAEPVLTPSPVVKPLTPSPVVNKDRSWLIILIVTIACVLLLCCLCCALAACLYVCLHHRAREKAYFPASVEGHDEQYHNWRCGNIDEVKLEEYKI